VDLVEVTGSFDCVSEAASHSLLAAIGEDGHVAWNASTSVAHVRLSVTDDKPPFANVRTALDRFEAAVHRVGVGEPYELTVRVQELVAIGGNHWQRGNLVQ
jgi:hypothetical protein